MELNKLCEKIIGDAQINASKIIDDANRKSIELIKNAEKKYNEKAEKIKSGASAQAKDVFEKILSDANLHAQKEVLSKKRELIDLAFKKAYEKLINLTLEEYKELLSKKAKEISEKAEVSVIQKFDKEITAEFLKNLNPLLSKSKKTVESGFCFSMENSKINYDFSEAVYELKEEKDTQVSYLLFS